MSTRQKHALVTELAGLVLRERGLDASTKPPIYTTKAAKQRVQDSDVLVPGLAALAVKTGERRWSGDLDGAVQDAARDGALAGVVLYERAGHPFEESFVLVRFDHFASMLTRVRDHADAAA